MTTTPAERPRRDWLKALRTALFVLGGLFIMFSIGEDGGIVVLILGIAPFIVGLLSSVIVRHRFGWEALVLALAGFVSCFIAMWLLIIGTGALVAGHPDLLSIGFFVAEAALLITLAAFLWAMLLAIIVVIRERRGQREAGHAH
jgi:4-hydroxybenzoate polyprenyltransferase